MSADVHIADVCSALCAQHLIKHLYSKDQNLWESAQEGSNGERRTALEKGEGILCFPLV